MNEKLLSIIIPVYNEEKIITAYLPKIFTLPISKEIIIINDGSTDETLNNLQSLKTKYDFRLINQIKNTGKGEAIKNALKEINGDYFIICDADAEYSPQDIPFLFKKIIEIKDEQVAIYGSRFLLNKKYSFHYFVNYFLTALTNLLFGSHLSDMETCFKLIPKEALKKIKLSGGRFEIEPEITAQLLKANYKIIELPINYKRRSYQEGKKIKARDGLLAIKTLAIERIKK
jgi:glycosyltransferase involved in cell wall biosynthesis